MSTADAVYGWLKQNADADGIVETICQTISTETGIPKSTVQHAVTRLQERGKLVLIAPRRFAVVELAELED